jgi:hypothetical protein
MSVRLYVGNLAFSVSEPELEDLFGQVGQVTSANIVTDRDTGRSRGFGFVEMESREAADAAIEAFNGREVGGRSLTVTKHVRVKIVAVAALAAVAVAAVAVAVAALAAVAAVVAVAVVVAVSIATVAIATKFHSQ